MEDGVDSLIFSGTFCLIAKWQSAKNYKLFTHNRINFIFYYGIKQKTIHI
jgi:hypothetical protein